MIVCFFFFFKQKTAYEMRISDWSSDVCSSDLPDRRLRADRQCRRRQWRRGVRQYWLAGARRGAGVSDTDSAGAQPAAAAAGAPAGGPLFPRHRRCAGGRLLDRFFHGDAARRDDCRGGQSRSFVDGLSDRAAPRRELGHGRQENERGSSREKGCGEGWEAAVGVELKQKHKEE